MTDFTGLSDGELLGEIQKAQDSLKAFYDRVAQAPPDKAALINKEPGQAFLDHMAALNAEKSKRGL